MTRRFRGVLSALGVAAAVSLQACEDDPILEPTSGDKTGGGSYGMIFFPQSSTGAAVKAANPATF